MNDLAVVVLSGSALGIVACVLLATATSRNEAHAFALLFLALAVLFAFPLALSVGLLVAGDLP